MRSVLQRVTRAQVRVEDEVVGTIGLGLLALVGVTVGDGPDDARALADKIAGLRIFADTDGAMNLSVADVGGAVLVVSQFTLYADARRGRRPSFVDAAPPETAEPLVDQVTDRLRESGLEVATGRFGALMELDFVNHGPVTIILETRDGRLV